MTPLLFTVPGEWSHSRMNTCYEMLLSGQLIWKKKKSSGKTGIVGREEDSNRLDLVDYK